MKFMGSELSPSALGLVLAAVLPAVAACSNGNGEALAHEFQPTIEKHDRPSGPAPEGMVWIPGGEFSMGANDSPDMDEVGMKATTDARPIHRVYVDGF
jgi:formylglycine-generating enzyme required for sulfatase activity